MTVQISEVVGMVGVLSGTVAILSAVVPFSWRFIQSKRLHEEELIHGESHNLKLFEALSSSNPQFQLAAAAVLAERLTSSSLKDAEAEHRIIVRALLAVTKNMGLSSNEPVVPKEISKFVADSIVKNAEIPLKQFDWQNTRLSGTWWEGVNASGIDFWQADLSQAGFRKVIFPRRCFG